MKIMIDARFYGLENAGLGRYAINLLDNLQSIDNSNEYLVLLRDKYFNKLKFAKKWKKVRAESQHYTMREQFLLSKLINKYKPDIFHALNPNIPYFCKRTLVVTVHDLTQIRIDNRATTHLLPVYLIKLFAYKRIFSKAVKLASKIIVPSQAVKKDLVDFYDTDKNKVVVIYEGVNSSTKKSISAKFVLEKYGLNGKKYFMYTGSAYPHKNLERTIEALKYLNEKSSEKIYLAISSSRSKFTKRLSKTMQKNNMEKYVLLLGFVPDEFVDILSSNSVGFIYPSIAEGFGLPGLEALQSGTLLLASDIAVFNEVYEDNAIYFNPYDFTSISSAMDKALKLNPNSRAGRISKGQEFINKYSWRKMAEETLKVYEDVRS